VGSLRRRATIFGARIGDELLIIKTQYHDVERRFEEGHILKQIHRDGDFPGVVRVLEGGSSSDKDPIPGSPVGEAGNNAPLDRHRNSRPKMHQTVLVLRTKQGP
jgi:hypothetical protein